MFTLYTSAALTVRVAPPDRVILDGDFGTLTVRRSQLRASITKDHVVLRVAVDPPQELRFARTEGLVDAIALARHTVLFAMPGFSVSVSDDDTSIVVAMRGAGGHVSVPVPVARLHVILERAGAPTGVRHALPTGLAPGPDMRWLELAFLRERPWSVGPLRAEDASVLVEAFDAYRRAHPIDEQPSVVEPAALAATPSQWHARRIDVTARWHYAFEHSSFMGAWLETPAYAPVTYGTYRARVVGTWIYPHADRQDGYGHMGCWPGVLEAETIEIVEVIERPHVTRDALTGLPKRDAIGAAFAHAARPLSLAMLDIDWLKRINDTHGHVVGDQVLRACAAAMMEALRPADIVARWAGEEFAVLLPGTALDAARVLLDGVLARVRAHPIGFTISAGLVEVGPGETAGTALARADRALYDAKRTGRDRIVIAGGLD